MPDIQISTLNFWILMFACGAYTLKRDG